MSLRSNLPWLRDMSSPSSSSWFEHSSALQAPSMGPRYIYLISRRRSMWLKKYYTSQMCAFDSKLLHYCTSMLTSCSLITIRVSSGTPSWCVSRLTLPGACWPTQCISDLALVGDLESQSVALYPIRAYGPPTDQSSNAYANFCFWSNSSGRSWYCDRR